VADITATHGLCKPVHVRGAVVGSWSKPSLTDRRWDRACCIVTVGAVTHSRNHRLLLSPAHGEGLFKFGKDIVDLADRRRCI